MVRKSKSARMMRIKTYIASGDERSGISIISHWIVIHNE